MYSISHVYVHLAVAPAGEGLPTIGRLMALAAEDKSCLSVRLSADDLLVLDLIFDFVTVAGVVPSTATRTHLYPGGTVIGLNFCGIILPPSFVPVSVLNPVPGSPIAPNYSIVCVPKEVWCLGPRVNSPLCPGGPVIGVTFFGIILPTASFVPFGIRQTTKRRGTEMGFNSPRNLYAFVSVVARNS
ncbi:hypothetical protein J6590_010587 [Homalodisca vitripennis]|nr:hypothetical protein J6590_010587 [Homalodisca vitripennis]